MGGEAWAGRGELVSGVRVVASACGDKSWRCSASDVAHVQQQRLRGRALQRAQQPLHARRPERAVNRVDRAQRRATLTRRRDPSEQLGREARPEGRRRAWHEARVRLRLGGAAPRRHGGQGASVWPRPRRAR